MGLVDTAIQKGLDVLQAPKLTTGEKLKHDLGLDNFKYVYIQKLIDISIQVYIITLNSRYPTVHLPRQKLSNVFSFSVDKVNSATGDHYSLRSFKLTPAIYIEEYDSKIYTKSVIIRQDIGGDNYVNQKMYESIIINNEIKFKEVVNKMKKYVNKYSEAKKKEVKEDESDEQKAKDSIKGIIDKDWGGSNEDQYASAQLITGLAGNDSKVANDFMDDLNKLTDKMDLSKYGI